MSRRLIAAGGIGVALMAAKAVREGRLVLAGASARAVVSAEREITVPADKAATAVQLYQQAGDYTDTE